MIKLKKTDSIALLFVIAGALNWGLIGFFQYDFIAGILGGDFYMLARAMYILIGASAVYLIIKLIMAK